MVFNAINHKIKKNVCNNSSKHFVVLFLGIVTAINAFLAIMTYIDDPYVHYHSPKHGWTYSICYNGRYSNLGMTRQCEYSGLLVGSSQVQNLQVECANKLWNENFIKLYQPGASYKEIGQVIEETEKNEHVELKHIIRPLDIRWLIADKDALRSPINEYPTYLYDDNVLNDISYLLNVEVALKLIEMNINRIINGNIEYDMDSDCTFLEEEIWDWEYNSDILLVEKILDDEDRKLIYDNLCQNVISYAQRHPDVTLDLFFPPYTMAFWSSYKQNGELLQIIQAKNYAIDILSQYDNINLHCFDMADGLCDDFGNFVNEGHYNVETGAKILNWIVEKDYLITKENKEVYKSELTDFFINYDFDARYERYLLEK